MDASDSITLLQEAREIESTAFWKIYNEYLEKARTSARQKCYERGDKEYEKGMVEAFNVVLGYKDMKSMFNAIRESINAGVADKTVPK
jgi:hypothetical protein